VFCSVQKQRKNVSSKILQPEVTSKVRSMRKTILSTVDVARLFDVTETTVKRWADDGTLHCHKTPGGHRKFPMRDVIEFAERSKCEPVGVLSLPKDDDQGTAIQMAVIARDFRTLVRIFVEKALSPDRTDLSVYFSYLYEHRFALWEICDNIVRPGMTEVGELLERGEIGINQEHRASYEVLDALARLQAGIFIKPDTGKAVVLACIAEELHEIGLRTASYIFEAEGWTTHYIGARTPPAAVVSAVEELRPGILALSMTTPVESQRSLDDLRRLTLTVHGMGVIILVGGAGVPQSVREFPSVHAVLSSGHDILDYLSQKANPGEAS